jgi:hypothetical protein
MMEQFKLPKKVVETSSVVGPVMWSDLQNDEASSLFGQSIYIHHDRKLGLQRQNSSIGKHISCPITRGDLN